MDPQELQSSEIVDPICVLKFLVPSGSILGNGPAWSRTVFTDKAGHQVFVPVFFGGEETERSLVKIAALCGAPILRDKHAYLPLEFYEIAYPEYAAIWLSLRCGIALNMTNTLPVDRN